MDDEILLVPSAVAAMRRVGESERDVSGFDAEIFWWLPDPEGRRGWCSIPAYRRDEYMSMYETGWLRFDPEGWRFRSGWNRHLQECGECAEAQRVLRGILYP